MNAVLKPLEFDFRPMSPADLDEIVRIERAAYPYPWTLGNFRDCLDSGYSCWVAEFRGQVSGYWIMMMAVGEGHVLNCCVAPAWQGRGFGRVMMGHLMDIARGHNTECLFLEVRPSNAPALGLYRRLGFDTIGVRKGYYPADQGHEDAIVMKLDL